MAVNTKAIKSRISSVKNTKKITKAMEMVSAAKMRRAVEAALGTRSYAELALELLVNISKENDIKDPLLENRPIKKILAIIVGGSKGLCGSFNYNIGKATKTFTETNRDKEIEYITIGKKAEQIARSNKYKTMASFIGFSDKLRIEEITGLSKIIIDEFSKGNCDEVVIIHTNFISSISYKALVRPLLPINQENVRAMIKDLGKEEIREEEMRIKNMALYLFEPNEEEILSQVLPKLTEVQVYQALLESIASEHSARMMAMRNASDSADEMLEDLTLSFNQARQAGITQEIAEIASGAQALS